MVGINVDEIPLPQRLPGCYRRVMTSQKLENVAHLRRARDLIDREDAKPLGVRTKAPERSCRPPSLAPVARGVWRDSIRLPDDPQVEGAMAVQRAGGRESPGHARGVTQSSQGQGRMSQRKKDVDD
jgi:hypothetical protein